MRSYTLTDLNNRSGEIVEAAHSGPVDITSRGKRKFVILTAAMYDRIAGKNEQRSYHADHVAADERAEFLAAFDTVADGDADDQ